MDFDWTTFILEIINFLILVWILKRFLYHPILDVIAQRRAGIEKMMADAKRIETEAIAIKQHNESRLAEWANEKEVAQANLLEELAAEREHKMAMLETQIAEQRERNSVLDERRQRDFKRSAEERGVAQGAAFSAKLLERVAGAELEETLYSMLLEDLRKLRTEDRHALTEAAALPGLQVRVQSAFALDEKKRAGLTRVLLEVAGKSLPIEFRENTALLSGFQVDIGPWVLRANLRDELKFFSGVASDAG